MVKLTTSARQQLAAILLRENSSCIRFGLKSTGCAGFEYYLAPEPSMPYGDDDAQVEIAQNQFLVVDALSLKYLKDVQIDFVKTSMGSNFVYTNPNSTGACGCNKSVTF